MSQFSFELPMPNDILVLSIDFDGCTDTPESRLALIEHITRYCTNKPQYKEIYIAIGSLRQSAPSDYNNAICNSEFFNGELHSCSVLLGEFVDKLKEYLATEISEPPTINKMKLLMADIYHRLEEGKTFELISSKNYNEIYQSDVEISWDLKDLDDNMINAFSILGPMQLAKSKDFIFDDTSKCLTLYNLFHHMYSKIQKTFDVLQIDDRIELLSDIENHFIDNKHQIPQNCSYQSLPWRPFHPDFSSSKERISPVVYGNGIHNRYYYIEVRTMAYNCLQSGQDPRYVLNTFVPAATSFTSTLRHQSFLTPKPKRSPAVYDISDTETTSNIASNP